MNTLSKLLIIFLLGQASCTTTLAQSNKATLAFPNGYEGLFNSYINFKYSPLEIRKGNKSNNSTIKTIIIDKPLHLYNSTILKHLSDRSFQSLLLLPGDSIVFGADGKSISYAKGYSDYIDNLISIKSIYPEKIPNSPKDKTALTNLVESIDKTYQANEVRIKNLKTDGAHRQTLSEFNYIVKLASFTNDSFKNLASRNDLGMNKILDSIYLEIIENHSKFDQFNSPFINRVYFTIINYKLQKQGIAPIKKWDHLNKISSLPFFKKFLILALNNANDQDPKERDVIYSKIKASKFADVEINKLYLNLKKQSPILEGITLDNSEKIKLVDTKNNPSSLLNLLNKHKGKVIIIDFWASWCVPCRQQFPAFKQAKAIFKEQNIVFLNFSIDEDNKVKEWYEALREEKETANVNQYRLVDWKNSYLTKQLALRTIPRYIIIDGAGEVQNANYYMPSDPRFIEGLKAYLQK